MTPQSDWKPFKVPQCECGHRIGDHKSGGSSFPYPPVIGACLRCDCPKYVEVDEKDEAA